VAPGWRFTLASDDDRGAIVVRGRRLHPFRARTVDEKAEPVPFANVGGMSWTLHADGTSIGGATAAMADSRGIATILADPEKPPRVKGAELGDYDYPGRAVKLDPERQVEVVVTRDPFVAVRVPDGEPDWTNWVLGWHGAGRAVGGGIGLRRSSRYALLFRWPSSLPLWANDAEHGPPVAVAADQARAAPLHVLDRRAVVRETPLLLAGDVPVDLSSLRSQPAAIAGHQIHVSALHSDYLVRGAAPEQLALATRDALEHEVWLLHPDAQPLRVRIAAGAAGNGPVTAKLLPGAPCTLGVKLSQPLAAHVRPALRIRPQRLAPPLLTVRLRDARFHDDAVTKGIALRAPFALPPGPLELQLDGCDLETVQVTVDGTTALRVDFTPK
jgi:hypothetical protein